MSSLDNAVGSTQVSRAMLLGSIPTDTNFIFLIFLLQKNCLIDFFIQIVILYQQIEQLCGNVIGCNSNVIGIDPYRSQFHFPCWIIKRNLRFQNHIIKQSVNLFIFLPKNLANTRQRQRCNREPRFPYTFRITPRAGRTRWTQGTS